MKQKQEAHKWLNKKWLYLVSLPGLVFYTAFVLVPLVMVIVISFTNWKGLTVFANWNFTGFKNYLRFFAIEKEAFLQALCFTVKFVLLNTLIQNILTLALALLINLKLRGSSFLKTVLFIPSLISVIIVGYLWKVIFSKIIPVVLSLTSIHLDGNLLANPDTVIYGLLIINNWQWLGYWMLIYLAALSLVPPDPYEAAKIDGASKFRTFFSITIPLIMPAIIINTIVIFLGSFQLYDLIISTTDGGPGKASVSFVMYIYNLMFNQQDFALAAAATVIYVIFMLLLAVGLLIYLNKKGSSNES